MIMNNTFELVEMGKLFSYLVVTSRISYSSLKNRVALGYESITFSSNLLQILGYSQEEFVRHVRTIGFFE